MWCREGALKDYSRRRNVGFENEMFFSCFVLILQRESFNLHLIQATDHRRLLSALWAVIKNNNKKSQTIWGLENYTAIIASLLRFPQTTREDKSIKKPGGGELH